MEKVITTRQQSDMGSGFGHIEGAVGCTLAEVLDFYAKTSKTWGIVCIYRNGNVVRKFDYNTFDKNIFYHHLSGYEYKFTVKEAKFEYCFMHECVDIYI